MALLLLAAVIAAASALPSQSTFNLTDTLELNSYAGLPCPNHRDIFNHVGRCRVLHPRAAALVGLYCLRQSSGMMLIFV
jgi:hypothetical protein